MTPRLSDADLAQIAAREQAATEGPWVAAYPDDEYLHHGDVATDAVPGERFVICEHAGMDAEFIAHARTDVPVLLDEVEALRGERDVARAAVEAVLGMSARLATSKFPEDVEIAGDLRALVAAAGYPTEEGKA